MCEFFSQPPCPNIAYLIFVSICIINKINDLERNRELLSGIFFGERLLQLLTQSDVFYAFSTFRWNFRAALKNPPGQTRWTAIGSIVARSKINTRRSCLGAGRFPAENPEEENLAVREIAAAFLFIQPNSNVSSSFGSRLHSAIRFSFSRNRERRFKRANEARGEVCMVYVRRKTKYL